MRRSKRTGSGDDHRVKQNSARHPHFSQHSAQQVACPPKLQLPDLVAALPSPGQAPAPEKAAELEADKPSLMLDKIGDKRAW